MSSEGPQAAQLRRAIYGGGAPNRTDLVGLISLAAQTDDAELLALLADVARDALLVEGELDSIDADWLMEVCGDGRGLGSYAEFEALTSVLRHATPAPAELVAFAAREIERAILTGERAYVGGADGDPGCVTPTDVAALNEIRRVSRPDRALAEVFFDIAHISASADNAPGFDALFAETVHTYLMGETPPELPLPRFWAGLAPTPAPELPEPEPLDALNDARYLEAADASWARCEAAASLPAPKTRWALAHLSRGELSSAERRLVALLCDPSETETRRAA